MKKKLVTLTEFERRKYYDSLSLEDRYDLYKSVIRKHTITFLVMYILLIIVLLIFAVTNHYLTDEVSDLKSDCYDFEFVRGLARDLCSLRGEEHVESTYGDDRIILTCTNNSYVWGLD
jgi:hypothetical protein